MFGGDHQLKDHIKGDLHTQIENIWRLGREIYHNFQEGDTNQGSNHCYAVDRNLALLIQKCNKIDHFKEIDLFILSAAACLHDIGKVHIKKINEMVGEIDGDAIDHGKRSELIIVNYYEKLGLERHQAVPVARIAGVHSNKSFEDLLEMHYVIGDPSQESADIRELAALFCLADTLDTSSKRAPELIGELRYLNGEIPQKWLGRQAISGWHLDHDRNIIFQANPRIEEVDAVREAIAMIREELTSSVPLLQLYGYPFEIGAPEISDILYETYLKSEAIHARPFPGMASYSKNDAGTFKGRDGEISKLLANVNYYQISVLVGESGAGKTSLIQAGLFPRLSIGPWKCVWTRPLGNPLDSIGNMIWSAFFDNPLDPTMNISGIIRKVGTYCKPQKVLIAIDQFEDVLRYRDPNVLEELSYAFSAVQSGTPSNLRILLAYREDSTVRLNSRLLKRITGDPRGLPSVELERLSRLGAKAAILAGLKRAEIGLDPQVAQGEKELLETILDDIMRGEELIFPPYLQMVIETLCKKVTPANPVITKDLYQNQLGGADTIIARYLIDLINEFGEKREEAKGILIALTSSSGRKIQKNIQDLHRMTGIQMEDLQALLPLMVDRRIIRSLGEDTYEIIHDYLGDLIVKEWITTEEREIKFHQDQFRAFFDKYLKLRAPIIDTQSLAALYQFRDKIKIKEEHYPFIVCNCLLGFNGLGWYWLRGVERETLLNIVREHLNHEIPEIRKNVLNILSNHGDQTDREAILSALKDKSSNVKRAAARAFVKIAIHDDQEKIIAMLEDRDYIIRNTASDAFVKISAPQDRDIILQLLKGERRTVKWAAAEAFVNIAGQNDRDTIIAMLNEDDWAIQEAAVKALVKISPPNDRTTFKIVVKFLESEKWGIRLAAVEAFGQIVSLNDRELILAMLKNNDQISWMVIAEAFPKIATLNDGKIIKKMLKRNRFFRKSAVKALGRIGLPGTLATIRSMLEDKNEDVRRTAIEELGRISTDPKDWEIIIRMLKDYNEAVRDTAIEVLNKIVPPNAQGTILDSFVQEAQGWGDGHTGAFKILSKLDREFYSPFKKNKT